MAEKSLPSLPKPQASYYCSDSSGSRSYRPGGYFDLSGGGDLGIMKSVNVEQESWLAGGTPNERGSRLREDKAWQM